MAWCRYASMSLVFGLGHGTLFNEGMGLTKSDWGIWLGLGCLARVIR